MQSNNSCENCKNQFDNRKFQPKELECRHVLCYQCAKNIYKDTQQIKCPQDGQATKDEPGELPTYSMKISQSVQIINDCVKHRKPNILFCSNDQIAICYTCVQQHQGHTITSFIKEGTEHLKMHQIKDALENQLLIKQLTNKIQIQINIQKQASQRIAEEAIQRIEQIEQDLVKFIQQQKQEIVQSIMQKQKQYKEGYDKSLQEVNQIMQIIEQIKFQNEGNFSEQMEFIEKIEETRAKLQGQLVKKIEIINQVEESKIKTIKSQLSEIMKVQFKEQENMIGQQLIEYKRRYEGLQHITSIIKDTQSKRNFKIGQKSPQDTQTNITKTCSYSTQIEQIGEQQLIISGDCNEQQKRRFTIYDKGNIKELNMEIGRYYHRIVYDHDQRIYILSGSNSQNVKECEVYNLVNNKNEQFTRIQDILEPVYLFGAYIDEAQSIYVTGGFKSGGYTNKIQVYDCQSNR